MSMEWMKCIVFVQTNGSAMNVLLYTVRIHENYKENANKSMKRIVWTFDEIALP